jgi:Fatty acid hydroxylase superfamily
MVRRFVPALLFPLLVAAIVPFYTAVALLERVHPYRPAWNRAAGDRRTDLLHLLFTGPLSNAAFEATLRGVATSGAVWIAAQLGASLWPVSLPALVQLYLAILVAEFGHYWFHRLSHENAWVWRLHATHHGAPRLYWLNATRFHPLDRHARGQRQLRRHLDRLGSRVPQLLPPARSRLRRCGRDRRPAYVPAALLRAARVALSLVAHRAGKPPAFVSLGASPARLL